MNGRRDVPQLPEVPDDVDLVAQWIRLHPEVWGDASSALVPDEVDAVVADIVSGSRDARLQASTHRRRKLIAGGVVGVLLVAGGAVGVAAIVRSGQPARPTDGVACRDGVGIEANVIVIEPTDDPIGGCGALWAAGRFAEPQASGGILPPLVACISEQGVIEVYPGDAGTCAGLGLADADPVLDDESQLIVTLQDRVVDEINAQTCSTARAVALVAQRLVDESGLVGWTVETRPDSVDASCAKAAVDPVDRVVRIVKFP